MAKTFYTNGTGSQQTLTGSQDEKVAVYQTVADAEADLANLGAGQIVATPDTGDENAQPVDVIQAGNMHAVTSNAVFDTYAVISASSTIITGKPISQRSVIKIMFTSDITGSNTSTVLSLTYNGTAYNVKVGKNGSLSNFVASEVSSGTYKYVQAYTTLELAFDGTQFIIIGNPVVLSSADYTIYADGQRYTPYGIKSISLSLAGWDSNSQEYTILTNQINAHSIGYKTYALNIEFSPRSSNPAPSSILNYIKVNGNYEILNCGNAFGRANNAGQNIVMQLSGTKTAYLRENSSNWAPTGWNNTSLIQASFIVRATD